MTALHFGKVNDFRGNDFRKADVRKAAFRSGIKPEEQFWPEGFVPQTEEG